MGRLGAHQMAGEIGPDCGHLLAIRPNQGVCIYVPALFDSRRIGSRDEGLEHMDYHCEKVSWNAPCDRGGGFMSSGLSVDCLYMW